MKPKGVIENTAFSSAEKGVQVVAGLIVIPFTLARLGMGAYGTWVLFNSIAGCFMLAQFGLSASFEKFIAELRSKNDHLTICSLISTALYSLSILGVIIGLTGWLLAPVLVKGLIPHQDVLKTAPALAVFIAINMVGLAGQIFISVPRGFMRFDISSEINIAGKIVEVFMTVLLLSYDPSINSLLWVASCSVFLILLGHIFVSIHLVGMQCINPRLWQWNLLRKMFLFGFPLQISFFANWVSQNLDKFIISRLFGPMFVALYDVGAKIPLLLRQAPMMLFAVLVPRFSEHSAGYREDLLRQLYFKGSAYVSIVSFAAIGMFLPVTGQVLSLWLHTEPSSLSISVFKILLVASMVQIIAGVGSSTLRGIGKPHLEALANSVMAFLNIVLSICFGLLFGVKGVVWGTAAALVIGTVIFIALVNHRIGVGNIDFFRKIIARPFAASICVSMAGIMYLPIARHFGQGLTFDILAIGFQVIIASATSLLIYRGIRIRFP